MHVDLGPVFAIVFRFEDFLNIDLHQRGYYHIRSRLKLNPKYGQGKIDVTVPRVPGDAVHMFPASVVEGQAVGTTIEILYQDEVLPLKDTVHFTLRLSTRVDKVPNWLELLLNLELWFCEKDQVLKKSKQDLHEGFRCLNKRCVRLRLNTSKGLHAFRPVLFDYTSLAGITLSVHASLTGLAVMPKKSILTPGGSPVHVPDPAVPAPVFPSGPLTPKLLAYHRAVATALLSAYEALQLKTKAFAALLPAKCPIHIQLVDTRGKLEALCARLVEEGSEAGRGWQALDEDRKLLGQELSVLWSQFLDLFLASDSVRAALAQEHHSARVKRFAEGFFMVEDTLHACIASLYTNGHNMGFFTRLTELCRKSSYFADLPRLPFHCSELDGESETMPIIFEEKFIHPGRGLLGRGSSEDGGGVTNRAGLSLSLSSTARPATPPSPPTPVSPASIDLDQVRFSNDQPSSPTSPLFLSQAGLCHINRSCTEPNLVGSRETEEVKMPSGLYRSKSLSFQTESFLQPYRRRSESDVAAAVPLDLDFNIKVQSLRPSPSTDPLDENGLRDRTEEAESFQGDDRLNDSGHGRGRLSCCLPICANRGERDVMPTTRASQKSSTSSHHRRVFAKFRKNSTSHSSSTPSPPPLDPPSSTKTASPPASVTYSRRSTLASDRGLTSNVDTGVLEFVQAKEAFKERLRLAGFSGHLCSDFVRQAGSVPMFIGVPKPPLDCGPVHLIVCVHGLDGSSVDLRPYRTYIRQGVPTANIDFLMSEANQAETFNDFETMSKNLVDELLTHLSRYSQPPARISFVAHSLGNIIVRSALCDPRLEPYMEKLYSYLSLNGPHCGVMFTRAPYDWGMSFVQWWKSSRSLEQLALRDHSDPRQTFLFSLSQKSGVGWFRYVLLVGSKQDMYVPCHSALIQPCKEAHRDSALGAVYQEMVSNLLESLSASQPRPTTLVRYTAFHGLTCMSRTHQVLGRAAHIAVLDDELFIEKLLCCSALQYFA